MDDHPHHPHHPHHRRLRTFVAAVDAALAAHDNDEPALLAAVGSGMRRLVAHDDWLPAQYAEPHPRFYRQYLLHLDPAQRFSVVSFVWGPGQATPVHDHHVWGVIGMLRGAERIEDYDVDGGGERVTARGMSSILEEKEVTCVSPAIGDVHRVSNAFDDRVSVSIHVYGGNIGAIHRFVYDPAGGARKPFVSGYANAPADITPPAAGSARS